MKKTFPGSSYLIKENLTTRNNLLANGTRKHGKGSVQALRLLVAPITFHFKVAKEK
jgi:hypothetical protein